MNNKTELIAHYIEHMSTKKNAQALLSKYGVPIKSSYTLKRLADAYLEYQDKISYEDLCLFSRSIWTPVDIDLHIRNLTSGLLVGHSWHHSRPSFLHRSLQDRVRECSNGDFDLQHLFKIGCDIMKQEYFIVATHDICESVIISSFDDVVPPSSSKSVTDFIFKDTLVDLKVSTYPDAWAAKAGSLTDEDKHKLVYNLYVGADKERMRKQAGRCKHNWGLNRLYVMVSNQSDWLSDPLALIDRMKKQLSHIKQPFCVTIDGFDINFFLVEL